MAALPATLPGPPAHYRDLMHAEGTQRQTVAFSSPKGDYVVNGRPYNVSREDFVLRLGAVVEWELISAEQPSTALKLHPYHQHMTHFQVVEMSGAAAGGALLTAVGDWRDTLPLFGAVRYVIRFVAPFVGLMTVHCHIQKHSEGGMMALARIEGPKV